MVRAKKSSRKLDLHGFIVLKNTIPVNQIRSRFGPFGFYGFLAKTLDSRDPAARD